MWSADVPSVLFLGEDFKGIGSDFVQRKIVSALQVITDSNAPDVEVRYVSGISDALDVIASGAGRYRVYVIQCRDVKKYPRHFRKICEVARRNAAEILWMTADDAFCARNKGCFYADYEGFCVNSNKRHTKEAVAYVAEAVAQWWTGMACGNRSVERIPLWDGKIPDYNYSGPEYINSVGRIDRISSPELEIFLPVRKERSPAVVFFPGGGLSYTGFVRNAREAAEILTPRGIAVIGVKYRVKRGLDVAMRDAVQALRKVRENSDVLNIDPNSVGVAGQSAGALIVLRLASSDNKDSLGRPDFVVPLTSWYFGRQDWPFEFDLRTPPFFMRHAVNDSGYGLALDVREKLLSAGISLDWKAVEDGGHGAFEITSDSYGHGWPFELVSWMRDKGFLKAPSYYGVYKESSIKDIHPESWLREILLRQRNGLGLNRAQSGYPYNTCLWNGIIPKGGNPIAKDWWPYEQSGYMVDGLYRCGVLLNDSTLIHLGKDNAEYVMSHPRHNGMLGPDALGDSQWAFSVFARELFAYYDYTDDWRVPVLMKNHFGSLKDTLTNRQTCIIESMCKMYSYTADDEILDKAEKIWRTFSMNGGTADNEFFKYEDMLSSRPVSVHGVTAAEVSKQPLILYLYTGKKEYLDAALGFYSALERDNELPDAVPASYEELSSKQAEALHETCDISDFLWSYGYLLMATGDVKWADKMESVVYNAALGAINKDFRALQYFSSPNQLMATEKSSMASYGDDGLSRQAYRPGFDVECCSGNVHRMFPNYISRMWMRDSEGGIVAALYGPSSFDAKIKGRAVSVVEDTDYPFSGKISFRFSMDDDVEFPFTLRIPYWSAKATLTINGDKVEGVTSGKFVTLDRKFEDGDVVELSLEMEPRTVAVRDAGMNVYVGPVLYSLKIDESVEKIVDGFKTSVDFPAYSVTPASKWNYGIPADPEIIICKDAVSGFPWQPETTPVRLRMKAYEIPSWRITGDSTPALPGRVLNVESVPEYVELIPSGCTRIRMTTFPIIVVN